MRAHDVHAVTDVPTDPDGVTAFEAAYLAGFEQTVRLAWLLTGDGSRAEEVAHDAWANAYRRHLVNPIDDVVPYVRTAVVNGARSRGRRGALERAYRRWMGPQGDVAGPEAAVVERDRVVDALAALPERMRTAVVLRHWLDLSVAEAAAAMGVSEGTVKSTVHRGLRALRELLEDHDA